MPPPTPSVDRPPGRRHVVLLAGPSGAGKSRLASRLGLPVLQLDNYYKDGHDPSLPLFPTGEVNWDDSRSWNAADAMTAVRAVCTTGSVDAPIYDISANGRSGHRLVDARQACCFVAEGIFAAELADTCEAEGVLGAAICVRRSRWVTFALRLFRDLREQRKPPSYLLRRGWWLARREPEIVAALVARGCRPMTPRQAEEHIRGLVTTG